MAHSFHIGLQCKEFLTIYGNCYSQNDIKLEDKVRQVLFGTLWDTFSLSVDLLVLASHETNIY